MSYFARVSPESLGISSAGILNFLEDIEKKQIELHSLMLLRHDQCAAAGWWKPYCTEYLQPVYSFSKCLTSTAIGFAWQEGILSLDERLVDLFPEEIPGQPSENLKKVTIHHLLCMSCGHETESAAQGENWIAEFLAHPFLHEPGTFFKYNTAGTNMLAAILKRKTGKDILEYLRPRLLEPLGIEEITCERLPGREQIEMGGAGMRMRTEDMAKFGTFLLHRGCWEGRRLLADGWFDLAVVKQIETAGDVDGHVKDWAQGYGYQFWMNSYPNSYRAAGAYGQYAFVFPTLDFVAVMTTAVHDTQSLVDSLMEQLIPAVQDKVLEASADAKILEKRLDRLSLPVLRGEINAELVKRLDGKIYDSEARTPEEACCSMEALIGGAGLWSYDPSHAEKMWFTFNADTVIWHVYEGGKEKQVTAALDGSFALSESEGVTYAATARYRSLNALEFEVRRVDAISGARLIFRFEGEKLRIEAEDTLITSSSLGIAPRKTCSFQSF